MCFFSALMHHEIVHYFVNIIAFCCTGKAAAVTSMEHRRQSMEQKVDFT